MPRGILTILLLVCSNAFMTLAWYGHIVFKSKLERVSLAAIALLSWGVRFRPTGSAASNTGGRSRCGN